MSTAPFVERTFGEGRSESSVRVWVNRRALVTQAFGPLELELAQAFTTAFREAYRQRESPIVSLHDWRGINRHGLKAAAHMTTHALSHRDDWKELVVVLDNPLMKMSAGSVKLTLGGRLRVVEIDELRREAAELGFEVA